MWPFGKDAKGRLREALGANDHTKDLDLEVEVMSGKAYVSGEVPDGRYENLIRSIANDTLAHIAQRYYGDGGRESCMCIAEANDISDPDSIQAGQKLTIPGTNTGPGEPT